MSAKTGISWADSTFNPWIGCTKVGPGCDNCYAERRMDARLHVVSWGNGNPRKRTSKKNWADVEVWNRTPFYECDCGYRGTMRQMTTNSVHGCGLNFRRVRRRVFCASLADWLDNHSPIPWRVDLLDLIRRTPNLDWILLTKRIGNWRMSMQNARSIANGDKRHELAEWIDKWLSGTAPANVWIGHTMVDQDELDRDLEKLYLVPAVVRLISGEPLLGSMNLDAWPIFGPDGAQLLHWFICGGESGPNARAMNPEWVRQLRDQCVAAGVPFHFKQWGEFAPNWLNDDAGQKVEGSEWVDRVGSRNSGRMLDGRVWNEFPAAAA